MMYSPKHDAFLITQKDLKMCAMEIKYAMKKARQIAGVSIGIRKCEGGLEPIDHLEKGLIEMATSLGIDFGASWGSEIDLTDVKG